MSSPSQPYGLPPEAIEGMSLTSAEARALEEALVRSPEDVGARTRLIGFYLLASAASPDAAWLGSRHVAWLVEHAPEAEVLGTPLGVPMNEAWCAEAGVLWRRHIEAHPRNDRILANAARFFGQVDRPFARQLRYRLQLIHPQRYADFSFDFEVPAPAPADERPSLASLEEALTTAREPAERISVLGELAAEAFRRHQPERAREAAEEVVHSRAPRRPDPRRGSALHAAHIVLGQLALDAGDLPRARAELLASTEVPASAQLETFGPDMGLARRLFEHGERQSLLEFFERCRAFWKMGHALLDAWEADVQEGRRPNFLGSART